MAKTGIIFGSNILLDLAKMKKKTVKTAYGTVQIYFHNNLIILPRHGMKHNVPPHRINHKAHMDAFAKEKIKSVIGISSVGSLKKNIAPGAIMIPYDYINLANVQTFFDNKVVHVLPEINEALRKQIISAAEKLNIPAYGGIYFQTKGPRLETKAEITLLSQFADVVGMTMATEATLAKELGIRYASICSIDNYANGISDKKLDFAEIKKAAKENSEKIKLILENVLKTKF